METDTFQFFLQNQVNSNYYDNINSVYRYLHNLYRCIWLVRDYMIHIHNLMICDLETILISSYFANDVILNKEDIK
jgi:hypothetical protein